MSLQTTASVPMGLCVHQASRFWGRNSSDEEDEAEESSSEEETEGDSDSDSSSSDSDDDRKGASK